jgi:hypothetical protein
MLGNRKNNGAKTTLSDVIYEREQEITRLKRRLDTLGIPYEGESLNGAYFRMGLIVGLVVAVLGVYFTYEIMS